jgi:hypothetical protein
VPCGSNGSSKKCLQNICGESFQKVITWKAGMYISGNIKMIPFM